MKKILLGCMMTLIASPAWAQTDRVTVVATLPPLAGMVQLLLPNAQPDCLLSGHSDPHHLTLSPRKIEQLRGISLLVRSSGDDGGWSGLRSFHGAVLDLWQQQRHPWLLPTAVMTALPHLGEVLVQQQALSAVESDRRVIDMVAHMRQLDAAWQKGLRPLRKKGVMMQHPAWQPLFDHYKVPVRAVLEHSHHGDGATPRALEAALKLLRGVEPPLLVVERSHANRMIDWLRQRVPTAKVLVLDALGRCGQPLDRLMKDNLRQLDGVKQP